MVKITEIWVEIEEGRLHWFENIAFFNSFRRCQWDLNPPDSKLAYYSIFSRHRAIERAWERQLDLPERLLEWCILIFGSVTEAALRVQNEETRDIIIHPNSIIKIAFTKRGIVSSSIASSIGNIVIEYPIHQAMVRV